MMPSLHWILQIQTIPHAENEVNSLTARGEELLCSLVVQQWMLLYCQRVDKLLVYEIPIHVGLAIELNLVGLLFGKYNIAVEW